VRVRTDGLILYDAASQPKFLAQTTQFLYPVETVLAAIEVKTTLDEEELDKTKRSKVKLRALEPIGGSTTPPFYLMAYGAGSLPETMISKVAQLAVAERPDYLCVLSSALLAGNLPAAPAESSRTTSPAPVMEFGLSRTSA